MLELESKKIYVGKTTNPKMSIANHFELCGSSWTRKYKPINIIELLPNCDDFDEDKYTLKYMEKYGINNVRGGSFCEIILPKEQISVIAKMISSSTDKCFICGQPGHFASTCPGDPKCKVPMVLPDPACTCPGSYFSAHRKSKCVLNKITETVWNFFPDENDMIESIVAEQSLIKQTEPINTQPIVQAQLQSQPQTIQQVITNTNTLIHPCQYCGKEGHYASDCFANTHVMDILNQFAYDVTEININSKNIEGILDFSNFTKLTKLDCVDNKITSLNNLPNSLIELNCGYNKITSLDNLPTSLIKLRCEYNKITSLDNLPTSLIELICNNNKITSLDNLPNSLIKLNCFGNEITSLDNLPNSLIKLDCCMNNITSLDNLPNSLIKLYCSYNNITSLDNLPNSLTKLYCTNNEITRLDNLPNSLIELCCYDNNIITLDNLPKSLTKLYYGVTSSDSE